MFILEIIYVFLQAVAWIVLIVAGWVTFWLLVDVIVSTVSRRRRERRAEIEEVLDRKQAELRRAVLDLADALAEERVAANHASAEMIRSAYLTRGQLPTR